MLNRKCPALLLPILIIAAVAALACGGSGEPPQENATVAPPSYGPVTIDTPPEVGLLLQTRTASVGDDVQFTTWGWPRATPLVYYLFPDQTRARGMAGFLSLEKAVLGEVVPDGGAASITFTLRASYVMESGAALEITPGSKLYILVQQGEPGLGRSTGPLVVD